MGELGVPADAVRKRAVNAAVVTTAIPNAAVAYPIIECCLRWICATPIAQHAQPSGPETHHSGQAAVLTSAVKPAIPRATCRRRLMD